MNYLPPEEVLDLIVLKAQDVEHRARAAKRAGFTLKTAEELAFAVGELEGARQMLKWSYDALVSYSWASSTMQDRYLLEKQQKTEF